MPYRGVWRFALLAIVLAACAEVQRVPGKPVYSVPVYERSEWQAPESEGQNLRLAVRPSAAFVTAAVSAAITAPSVSVASGSVTAPGGVTAPVAVTAAAAPQAAPAVRKFVEVKLAGAPVCSRVDLMRMNGYTPVHGELSRNDKILMWTGFGGAGLTALLYTIGAARGQDPGRGAVIFGFYGLPLAGLGAYEWWRARTVTEPTAPIYSRTPAVAAPCPAEKDRLLVQVGYADGATVAVKAGPREWTEAPLIGGFDAVGKETVVPLRLIDRRLTGFLEKPRFMPVAAPPVSAAVEAPPAVMPVTAPVNPHPPAPAAVTAAAAPAPVTAVAAPKPLTCADLAVMTPNSGWLPKEFFSQAIREYRWPDEVSLRQVAVSELGGKQFVWQIEELNPEVTKGERPARLKLPVSVQPASYWKERLPAGCE